VDILAVRRCEQVQLGVHEHADRRVGVQGLGDVGGKQLDRRADQQRRTLGGADANARHGSGSSFRSPSALNDHIEQLKCRQPVAA
jgi:hypothetical protein